MHGEIGGAESGGMAAGSARPAGARLELRGRPDRCVRCGAHRLMALDPSGILRRGAAGLRRAAGADVSFRSVSIICILPGAGEAGSRQWGRLR